MYEEVITCDRCRIKVGEFEQSLHGWYSVGSYSSQEKRFDLCEGCRDSFIEFVHGALLCSCELGDK